MTKRARFLCLALLGAVLAAGLVFAEGTAANEDIINVASATYNDSSGNPQTTTSNPVTTLVQQIYNFTITPNSTGPAAGATDDEPSYDGGFPDNYDGDFGQLESALPGAPVYLNYTVTNTGNGTDAINLVTSQGTEPGVPAGTSFGDLTGVTIYLDTGCDGSVAGDSPITSVTLNADEPACIIVTGTIPNTADDGDVGNIDLEGTSAGDNTVTDTDNWAQAEANTAGNVTGNKVASPGSGTPVAAGGTISYSITGSNNGGSAAYGVAVTYEQSDAVGAGTTTTTATTGIFVQDVLDSDAAYAAATLSGTAGAGTVVLVYRDDTNGNWYDEEADVPNGIDAVGMIIVDPAPTSAFFPQSANYSMSFSVTVASGATTTASINNSATISYDTDDNAGTGTSTTATNTTNTPVAASYDVAVGPDSQADADGLSGTASYTDPATGATWNVNLSGGFTAGDDTQTITDTVFTGNTVAFRHTIKNTGNTTDSFTVTASSTAGYTVTRFQADGVAPLTGPVGPLAPGAEVDIVVKVNVSGTSGDTVTVTATSAASNTTSDVSTDVIPTPVSRAVDLATNSDNVAGGQAGDSDPSDDDPANRDAQPGDALSYPIEIVNTGNTADGYDFSENVPAGWTVTYYTDPDCDGDRSDGTALASPEETGSINAGATVCFVAEVTVAAGAANDSDPGTAGFQPYDVEFTVTSQADNTVSDTISTEVTVQVADISFVSDQSATTSPDSVVTYTHTLINDGNLAASVDIPAQSGTAFTYQYSADGVNFTSSLSGVSVSAGGTQTVYVRVVVPGTANDGDSETVSVEAQAAGTTTVLDSVTDTTTVQAGELDLVKSAVTVEYDGDCDSGNTQVSATGAAAEPGDCIRYTVVATNIGSGDLTNVKVSDPLPGFTDFFSVGATTTAAGTVLYSTDGSIWTTTAPTALATGGSVYAAVDNGGTAPATTDGTIDTNDVLAPGESITLTFVVRVQ